MAVASRGIVEPVNTVYAVLDPDYGKWLTYSSPSLGAEPEAPWCWHTLEHAAHFGSVASAVDGLLQEVAHNRPGRTVRVQIHEVAMVTKAGAAVLDVTVPLTLREMDRKRD
jgi:hypothetical protein